MEGSSMNNGRGPRGIAGGDGMPPQGEVIQLPQPGQAPAVFVGGPLNGAPKVVNLEDIDKGPLIVPIPKKDGIIDKSGMPVTADQHVYVPQIQVVMVYLGEKGELEKRAAKMDAKKDEDQ